MVGTPAVWCNPARDKDHHHKKEVKYLSARGKRDFVFLLFRSPNYKTKGHNFQVLFFFLRVRFYFRILATAPWGCFCSNVSSSCSDSHDTKCSNDRKTTTFGLLLASCRHVTKSFVCFSQIPFPFLEKKINNIITATGKLSFLFPFFP